jgi:hypothetical protein
MASTLPKAHPPAACPSYPPAGDGQSMPVILGRLDSEPFTFTAWSLHFEAALALS